MTDGTSTPHTPAEGDRAGHPPAKSSSPAGKADPEAAPGGPGKPAAWAWGAKVGVGTALGTASSVAFTLSHGILTEVYYPSVDTACTRDLGLLVADRRDFFSAEEQDTHSEVSYLAPGVPAYRLLNTCTQGRYRLEKEVIADPRRSVVLQQTHFVPLQGGLADYCLCALLRPRLGNQGSDNTGWVGEFKGIPMLFARRQGLALALACSAPWKMRSAGFAGVSDGWEDLARHKRMTWAYQRAEDGNVALTGEIDLEACGGRFVLALGFGRDDSEAGHRARASLLQGFGAARTEYVKAWSEWQHRLLVPEDSRQPAQELYRTSALVMRTHEAKDFPGAIVASLAIPWGYARYDRDMGYHLVWPRDMIEIVGGLLAIQCHEDARRVLFYLHVTQDHDGHWPQNMFLDGRPCWSGTQLDETALVILLVSLARRREALNDEDLKFFWPMVRRAAGFLVRNGPVTPMDRWEEKPGYYASTMAVEIPALLIAAEMAETQGETTLARYLRETADAWNDAIDRLIYVRGTDLARRAGVEGYYVRSANPDQPRAPEPASGTVTLPNHPEGQQQKPASAVVSPDALLLVRYGLRAADDPRLVNTVRVIDLLCKVETPRGTSWHRYNDDGYGEHADGAPFDGTGIGRAWPLLTGERAHYEVAAGRIDEAERLLRALEGFAGDTGLFPEQVWDTADIPEQELYFGRPSGSAMPLVWAHAEYVKLRRSLHERRVFDMPPQAVQRYLHEKTVARHAWWRPDQPWREIPPGKVLRLELSAPASIRWSADDWHTGQEVRTRDTGLGIHVADLPTASLPAGSAVVFRLHDGREGRPDQEAGAFRVLVAAESETPAAAEPSGRDGGRPKAEFAGSQR